MVILLPATLLIIIGSGFSTGKIIPEVRIQQGSLRGKHDISSNGRQFATFIGIPYAQPPIGDLRFKAPIPAQPWEGILDATKLHPVCPQSNPLLGEFQVMGDEDCLYLNVYTPQIPPSNAEPLPVMFYIHGGAFVSGSGRPDWYEPNKILDKDVVMVAINYRLGALGFMSTGDEVVPGNNGLKDQAVALKWTVDNIAAFGGDPKRITVVGHSAGSASTHFLVLSPLTRDLIRGAILQSGVANSGWAVARNKEEIKNSKRLAKFLNCPTDSSKVLVDCLKNIKAEEIIQQEPRFLEWSLDPLIPFKPVIELTLEGAFITEHPLDIIKSGKAADIPLVIGITTEDGAIKSASYYNNPQWINDLNQEFNRVLPISLLYGNNHAEKEHISNELRRFYFGNNKIDDTTRGELTNVFTDVIFLMGADEAVRLHTKYYTQPVYYYLFGYRGPESYSKYFGDPYHDYGVCHADELLYLFDIKQLFPKYVRNENDKKISNILLTLWTNFIATGNPTPEETSKNLPKWEPVVLEDDLKHLVIKDPDHVEMAKGLYTNRANFLQKLNLYSSTPLIRNEL